MNAKITYRIGNIPHPWNDKHRAAGMMAWCLIKVIKPEIGSVSLIKEEPVAIFDLNSEAELFMAHIYASNLNGKLVEIDRHVKEYLEYNKLIDNEG